MAQYKNTFNLASAAGQLVTTADKLNPRRRLFGNDIALSPVRRIQVVTVTFDTAATQTVTISVLDYDGTARIISSNDVVAATAFFFEPEHDIVLEGNMNLQVDVTATGAPAVTGTIEVFTEEA